MLVSHIFINKGGQTEMEGLIPILTNLLSGAVGGNLAGALMKNISMGTLWNTVLGVIGGGAGGQLLSMLGLFAGADGGAGELIGSIAGSAVGGGGLMAIVAAVKNMMSQKEPA